MARPKRSKTTFTFRGDPLEDNRRRAVWGPLDGKNVGFLYQLWKTLHPETSLMEKWKEAFGDDDGVKAHIREEARILAHLLGEEIAERLQARDASYFTAVAAMAHRCFEPEGIAHRPDEAALLSYVGIELQKNRARKFTTTELLDDVPWPKGRRPSERTLARLCQRHEVPRVMGRPRKK